MHGWKFWNYCWNLTYNFKYHFIPMCYPSNKISSIDFLVKVSKYCQHCWEHVKQVMHVLDACNIHVSLSHYAIEKRGADGWTKISIIKCLDFGGPLFEVMSENNYDLFLSFSLSFVLCWFTWAYKDERFWKKIKFPLKEQKKKKGKM